MKLLFIEDEPELHASLSAEVGGFGVEVDSAVHAAEALQKLSAGGHDLIVCDLKIPASAEAPEPHKAHGIRVYDRARVAVPGVPVIIFSAFGELADLGDRLSEARPQDLYGDGPVKMVVERTKSQLREVVALIRNQKESLDRLAHEVEVSGADARAAMSELDERLLRIHAHKHGGAAAKARMLTGGKSGALTLAVEVERLDGSPASSGVTKLNELDEIEDEERRYETHVAPLLHAATYTNRLETLRAGAQHRGGLFYSLAHRYDASLFDALRADPHVAAEIIAEVQANLAPWHSDPQVQTRTLRDLRRLFVRDGRVSDLRHRADWRTEELEQSEIVVRTAPAHGDLHGGNILVTQDRRAILIDFGRVGLAFNAVDPVTLELSVILHPDAKLDLGGWPTHEQAERWNERACFLEDCPIVPFIVACRGWSDGASRGDRETDAAVYGFGLRQLLFDDVDRALAAAFSRGAADRLT
jgi:CheY-like chemotaxis protein